ncbi:hemolysin family protein [Hyphomicrobium sp. CS1BSMeth3]|uniref:hemolysin family protein n=1 Tax=Hyphomicrobium sp. CS1BSMeth3 TaxID=1892844 RepID=UPI000931A086|nr:hemolysin family protein [Hyphomicrobium sp. CS1BSMeth3]
MTLADDTGPRPEGTNGAETTRNAEGWLSALRNRLGLGTQPTLRDTLDETLRAEDQTGTGFSAAEREMLLRLLEFGTAKVEDVMVPRADITAIDESATLAELLHLFDTSGVSRIPLFHETLDDPRGVIHIKDLMAYLTRGGLPAPRPTTPPAEDATDAALPPIDLAKVDLSVTIASAQLRRRVLYVPPSMPAVNLLVRMQATHVHMALVVDEYGGTDGLVTIEDLIEQVVGEIEDEHDVAEAANIVEDPKQGLIAQARTPIEELEAHLGVKLLKNGEEEDIDTLGGLVFTLVGRVPALGEIVRHESGIEFEVIDADPRRVKKVRILRPGPSDDTSTQTPPATG